MGAPSLRKENEDTPISVHRNVVVTDDTGGIMDRLSRDDWNNHIHRLRTNTDAGGVGAQVHEGKPTDDSHLLHERAILRRGLLRIKQRRKIKDRQRREMAEKEDEGGSTPLGPLEENELDDWQKLTRKWRKLPKKRLRLLSLSD